MCILSFYFYILMYLRKRHCIKRHNKKSVIKMLSYTFYIGILLLCVYTKLLPVYLDVDDLLNSDSCPACYATNLCPNFKSGMYLWLVKILLLPLKYEIIMVQFNHSFFFIAPCKVITLNPLCILFSISSLLLFWWLSL